MAEGNPVAEEFGGVTAGGAIAFGFSVLLEGLLHDHARAEAPGMYVVAALTLGFGAVSYVLAHALKLPRLAYALFTDDDPTMRIAVRLVGWGLKFALQGCVIVLAFVLCRRMGNGIAIAFISAALFPLLAVMVLMLVLRVVLLLAMHWLTISPPDKSNPTTRLERFVIRLTQREDPERTIADLNAQVGRSNSPPAP